MATWLRGSLTRVVPLASIVVIIGCGGRDGAPTASSDVSAIVTGDAAAQLRTDGRFTMGAPNTGTRLEISATQAEALAAAWPRQFGVLVRGTIEEHRGAPVNLESLAPCGRTFYVEPSFDPLPADVPIAVQRTYGPWWLVPLCATPPNVEVTLAVSAYDTDLSLQGGKIVMSTGGGMWFWFRGIPPGQSEAVAVSPEAAAAAAAALTGHRVKSVPILVGGNWRERVAQYARWRVELDAPGRVRGPDGRISSEDVVYVDAPNNRPSQTRTWRAALQQPDTLASHFRQPPSAGQRANQAPTMPLVIRRRAAHPLSFEIVTSAPGGL